MLKEVYCEGLQPMERAHESQKKKCENEGTAEGNSHGVLVQPRQ